MTKEKLLKIIHHRNFPILVILLAGTILALCLFQNYGVSWDEPEYYHYANNTLYAYSISARMAGTFDLNRALGPNDLVYYGPAFLIIGEGLQAVFSLLFPLAPSIDLWHLILFLTFLLGVFFFYKLCQRWVSTAAATVATLLFASQPVLFGISWIDPKDIPFMVFFMGAIYFGLLFSDQARAAFSTPGNRAEESFLLHWKTKTRGQKNYLITSVLFCLIIFSLVIYRGSLLQDITNAITQINVAAPQDIFAKGFLFFAHNATSASLPAYARQTIVLVNLLLKISLVLSAVLLLGALIVFRYSTPAGIKLPDAKKIFTEMHQEYKKYPHKVALIASFLGACLFLGFTCATRILGPFAGLLVVGIWFGCLKEKSLPLIAAYALLSFGILFAFWPYLWQAPFANLFTVIRRMFSFPDEHKVFFAGKMYSSLALPAGYLPGLLAVTLTLPALFGVIHGIPIACFSTWKGKFQQNEFFLLVLWFFLPFAYVVLTTPPMYDNYRHFLFLLPALFLFGSFAVDFLFTKIRKSWINLLLALVFLAPGILADFQLHPYEYSYYNALAGELQGAVPRYEADYWLTCYKGITQQINAAENQPVTVYVDLNPTLVEFYANENLKVKNLSDLPASPAKGDLIILPVRWGDEFLYPEYPVVYAVKVAGVDLCIARKVE